MDIKIVDQQGKEVVEEQPTEAKTPATAPVLEGELLQQSVGQVFDLTPNQVNKYKNKIDTLIEFAKTQTEDHSIEGIKWAIRSLQGKVGTPPLGEKWITYLAKYAWIKLEGRKVEKEVEQYEHNH